MIRAILIVGLAAGAGYLLAPKLAGKFGLPGAEDHKLCGASAFGAGALIGVLAGRFI